MKVVVKYACEHCGKEFPKGSEAEKHEETCSLITSPRVKAVVDLIMEDLNVLSVKAIDGRIEFKLPYDFYYTFSIDEMSVDSWSSTTIAHYVEENIKKSFAEYMLVIKRVEE